MAGASGWQADPTGRFEQRFWNGSTWTDHVRRGGREMMDWFTPTDQASGPPRPALAAPYSPPVSRANRRSFRVALLLIPVLIATAVVQGLLNPSSGGTTTPPTVSHYAEDRAFCQDRATVDVEASDGLYSVGGNHWVDLVNKCLVTRAVDRP